ncbi:MAG: NAD-dependent epimerase/dehydratase family protein [Gemmatimonadales bacterium]
MGASAHVHQLGDDILPTPRLEAVVTRPPPRRVLVTGAGGFLGGHVCRAFAERCIPVRALIRRPSGVAQAGLELAPVTGLDDLPGLRRALAGVDAVIHLAAHVHQGTIPPADAQAAAPYRAVNVEGTRTLLEAAVAAGVRDFVFASSVKAIGDRNEAPWTETTRPAPADAYGVTKLEAEQLVRDQARRFGLHAPILRLPLVYGPGMKANALRLFQAVAHHVPLPVGGVANRRSFLFTGNLVAAMLATLANEAGDDTFFVSDGEDLSTADLAREIGRAMGRKPLILPVPIGALKVVGGLGDVLARVGPFPLTTAALDRLVGSLTVDSSKLGRATGYHPPYSVREGLRITCAWLREQGTHET